ncbi:TPA: helix-turn-helix domain-containing protein [Streptococcus pyogenes]|nr:helix-turn-helix transcriptional regulator [Streptococcus pyogenes]
MKNNLRVILARQRKKISDVHEATGVSKTTLTALYYERTENPDSKTLLKITKCLNVTLDELLTVED